MELENDMLKGKKRTFSDFKNSLNLDDQKLLHDIVVKNPNLNPSVNKNAAFEDLEKTFNDISGNDANKKAFYESKGISELTTSQVQADKEKAVAETTPKTKDNNDHHMCGPWLVQLCRGGIEGWRNRISRSVGSMCRNVLQSTQKNFGVEAFCYQKTSNFCYDFA